MNDLLLFDLLTLDALDDARIPALLDELARETLRERAPFFGVLAVLARDSSADVSLRRRALVALRGARGMLATETAVDCLREAALADEAVRVLAHVAQTEPARWAHVVFSDIAEVRALGVAMSTRGDAPRAWDLMLAADPAHRDAVIRDAEAGNLEPPGGIAVLLDLLREGVLPKATVWKMVVAKPMLLGPASAELRARSSAVVEEFLATCADQPNLRLLDGSVDELDTLLEVVPDEVADGLERAFQHTSTFCSQIAAAAWLDIDRRGPTPSRLQLLAVAHPASLRSRTLSHDHVRVAADAFHRWGMSAPSAVVDDLLEARACRPDGTLDLHVTTGILRLVDKDPFSRVLDPKRALPLAAALVAEPIGDVVKLLSLRDDDDIARRAVLDLVPEYEGPRTCTQILVAMLEQGPSALFGFVAGARELARIVRNHDLGGLEKERVDAFAKALFTRHGGDVFKRVVAPLAARAERACALSLALVVEAALALDTGPFVAHMLALGDGALRAVLAASPPGTLPLGKERALAERLLEDDRPQLVAWARGCSPTFDERPAPLARARQGVAYRMAPPAPTIEACVALLGSMDPIEATDAAFSRFASMDPRFLADLDRAMVATFGSTSEALSPLGHAWLWRWDGHALAHLDRGLEERTSLAALIRARTALVSAPLRITSVAAIASAIGVLSMRDKARFRELVDEQALDALVAALPTDAGLAAATALRSVAWARQHDLAKIARAARLLLPDLDEAVRHALGPLVDSEGLAPRRAVRVEPRTDEELLAQIRASSSLDFLTRLTGDERTSVIHEATLRLIELGEAGCARLATKLSTALAADEVRPIVESLPLWPDGAAKAWALALADDRDRPVELRFRVALAQLECGDAAAIDRAIALLNLPAPQPYFEARDWDLLSREVDPPVLARKLAGSAEPHVYIRAVEHLLAETASPSAFDALRAFLDRGTKRMGSLRRRVATYLHVHGDDHGFLLVVGQSFEETGGRPHLFDRTSSKRILAAARAFLAAGTAIAKEAALVHHLSTVAAHRAEEALEAVMTHGSTDKARMAAARLLSTRAARERKLLKIAEVFAWGARIAQRALGKPMRIRMTGTQRLGFTRTRENALFVTPLPILRGDPHGQEVVAALILHELGHHLHHAGPAAEKVWKRAEEQGLHGVFNLVADEHLERNLRAKDAWWGDLLKRLAAYAFQHTDRTVPVRSLVSHLGARAFDVLTQTRLLPARDDKSVVVESGSLLFTMEREGLSFARFARALRMGLGNRHEDPKVDAALALFTGRFRQSSMEDLWEITLKLREIFGFETRLCDSIGPHEGLEEGGVDGLVWNDGITQEDIDRLVERIANPEGRPRSTSGKTSGKLYMNVDPETKFDFIREVRPVPFDAVAYAPYRRKVDRPAAILRQYFEQLGLAYTERRMLTAGRRIDRPRLLPLALHGDPRALKSREVRPDRDLFLGVVVDCSGSMSSRDNIERAKLFGALVAEASRPLAAVDVRVFGFTDRTIFDCGPKERCGVHALYSSGGNNDAAALYHVAGVAKGSRRKAKVLVMISDGLPTECSVAALKHVVNHLSRREGMIVAQVAVQPLAEQCFPHYVVLTDASIEVTVRKFGGIVAGLVQKAMCR